MTQAMKYTATNDSVTIIWNGQPVTVKRGSANFEGLRRAVLDEDWDEVPHHLRSDSSLTRWAGGKFKVVDGVMHLNSEPLPSEINGRLVEMAAAGNDPLPLMKFWELLQANPSNRSVEQLWRFLNNVGIPLTPDGHFLAYKAVRSDFKDCYTGTVSNEPGSIVSMERNKISDDPSEACHQGLHVGALDYASSFGGPSSRLVICKVNPADVVCVPFCSSSQKMRVARYEVIGVHGNGLLSSTTIDDNDMPVKKTSDKKRSKEFTRLDSLSAAQLMGESYETLRKYASSGLMIVGASHITGGKWSLIQAIDRARY